MLSDLPPNIKIPEPAVYIALNDFFSFLEITIFNASSNLLYESNLTGRRNSIVQVDVNIQPSVTSNFTSIFRLLGKAIEPVANRRRSLRTV